MKSAWLNSTKALVICGDFKEPTEIILDKFKKELNGIIFEPTNDILSQGPLNQSESFLMSERFLRVLIGQWFKVKQLSLNLAKGQKSPSKYYGCYYYENGGKPQIDDVQLTADGNFMRPDEYYFYGESFDFETYFKKLKTRQIGQHFYHFNTISSTMVHSMNSEITD